MNELDKQQAEIKRLTLLAEDYRQKFNGMRNENARLEADNAALTAELEALREAERWRDVDAEPPEEGSKVIMYYPDGEQYICIFTKDWYTKFKLWNLIRPVNWRPLPTAPLQATQGGTGWAEM